MRKSRWHFFKNTWFIISVVAVIGVAAVIFMHGSNKAPQFESTAAEIGNVVERVSVTGTISPIAKADLAFEKSGAITDVRVSVGDQVKRGDVLARLDDSADKAAVASAQATLDDLSRSLTPQELAVQTISVANARLDAVNAAYNGFTKAQNALFSYSDAFFDNSQGITPTINVRTQWVSDQNSINTERANITALFSIWSAELTSTSTSNAGQLVAQARTHLSVIKTFLTHLSTIINSLSPNNSNQTQAVITADVTAMNAGLSVLNGAVDSVVSAQSALSNAESGYSLKISGNSAQSIAAQAARVAQAKALLAQDTLISPIDGTITKASPSVGEFVAAGQSEFSVSNSEFKIEAFVPEADIAKVAVGNSASTTLDAYGSDTDFPAQVTMIEPAETVLEGVPTYKVVLQFIAPDARIRSGMTANLEILTHERDQVLEIPYRAVIDTNGLKSVRVVNAAGTSYTSVPVLTGLKGSDGTIEIISGLNGGDKVVTYVK